MDIRAVIFDLDGTLIQSPQVMIPIIVDVAQSSGLGTPADAAARLLRRWGTHFADLLQELWSPDETERLLCALRGRLSRQPVRVPAYPGALEALAVLCRCGASLVLHTNRRQDENLDGRLRDAGIDPRIFAAIHWPRNGQPPKPQRDALLRVLQHLLSRCIVWQHEEACVVSDQVDDAQMAFSCDCAFIGVLTGASTREDFAQLDSRGRLAIVDSVADVPAALARL